MTYQIRFRWGLGSNTIAEDLTLKQAKVFVKDFDAEKELSRLKSKCRKTPPPLPYGLLIQKTPSNFIERIWVKLTKQEPLLNPNEFLGRK